MPYDGIRLQVRHQGPADLELGPAVGILWPGTEGRLSPGQVTERAALYYGHVQGQPGLWAIGFDQAVDWEQGTCGGYVIDNRPGQAGVIHAARFPIPAAVHLTWSIRRDVIGLLRERTGERTFNWVRNIGKWQFHTLLSAVPELRPHLPDTLLFQDETDLAAMLARYGVVFVKHAFGIKGRRTARICRRPEGLEVRHMDGQELRERLLPDLATATPYLRAVLGPGRAVVQQGIPLTGRKGRALDFRVVTVRDQAGGWRSAAATANVAPDDRVVFTNLANGATDEEMLESLQEHYGLTPAAARSRARQIVDLALAVARALEKPFHPLGILGCDIGFDPTSNRLWIFEANSVPGWGYPAAVEADLARSQVNYALLLTNYPTAPVDVPQ